MAFHLGGGAFDRGDQNQGASERGAIDRGAIDRLPQKPERSIALREHLKAFTEEKLVTSHGKLFQTLITRSEKTQTGKDGPLGSKESYQTVT